LNALFILIENAPIKKSGKIFDMPILPRKNIQKNYQNSREVRPALGGKKGHF
jgi:hypothetical protein